MAGEHVLQFTGSEFNGVIRKGAWMAEEDELLRDCIKKYGEGKWHLVPERAGLSRCRKSCRLRWLNYLKPNIKRGEFQEDEVDLIFRLHRLLGNRWSLIAGRIPGRTANDIKNYWNVNLSKRRAPPEREVGLLDKKVTVIKPNSEKSHAAKLCFHCCATRPSPGSNSSFSSTVIKPQPRKPSKRPLCLPQFTTSNKNTLRETSSNTYERPVEEDSTSWLKNLLEGDGTAQEQDQEKQTLEEIFNSFNGSSLAGETFTSFWGEETQVPRMGEEGVRGVGWDDLVMDPSLLWLL